MKYGLLYWKETDNIGDDIQAYAAMQFLPRVDYHIDREKMNAVEDPNHEPIAVIMNGWLLYNTFNWPPANDILPLLVSMHFVDQNGGDYLEGIGGEYLRNYGPVGCRDMYTLDLLKSKGIDGYFSGCMTLTLPKQPVRSNANQYVCVVDVPTDVERFVRNQAKAEGLSLVKTNHAVSKEIAKKTWEERIAAVEDLLGTYQNARCVVTSRLHCALPCLAMGVPVLLIIDGKLSDRFGPFLPMLNTADRKIFCEGKTGYDVTNPPANNGKHMEIRNQLIAKVNEFIAETQKYGDSEVSRTTFPLEQRVEWQTQLIQNRLNDLYAKPNAALEKFVRSRGVKPTLFLLKTAAFHLPTALWRSLKRHVKG